MKEAHTVFSLLALQTPICVIPLLVNTGACVGQSSPQRLPPESGFPSVPVPLPLEPSLVLQVKIFKALSPVLVSVLVSVHRTVG